MHYTITLLLVALCSIAHAQSPEGQWALDINRTVQLMQGSQRTNFESIPAKRKTIKQDFSQRIFRFSSDGSFDVKWFNVEKEQSSSGKWTSSGKHLVISVNEKDSSYSIREATTDKLVLEKEGGTEGLFKVLAFKRQ